jgi:hypothetical protein
MRVKALTPSTITVGSSLHPTQPVAELQKERFEGELNQGLYAFKGEEHIEMQLESRGSILRGRVEKIQARKSERRSQYGYVWCEKQGNLL